MLQSPPPREPQAWLVGAVVSVSQHCAWQAKQGSLGTLGGTRRDSGHCELFTCLALASLPSRYADEDTEPWDFL